jgi:uncharacterized protein (TIGR03437 family)
MNGRAAPLFGVANVNGLELVNFQVPFDVTGTATLVVTRNGVSSDAVQVPVSGVQPGVYTSDGSRAILVRNDDGALLDASRPARRGESVFFYATGLGAVTNAPAAGNAGPRSPLAMTVAETRVTIGGRTATVLYSGLAPDFAGLYQINVLVPADTPSGDVDLLLSVHGVDARVVKVRIE